MVSWQRLVRALCVPLAIGVQAPAAPPASALDPREDADTLVREGAALGERGDWDGAIEKFRAAERSWPRAMHDCNIGLAYVLSARHHLGWLYLGRCQARATETLPKWVQTRRQEALRILNAGEFTPLELEVSPPMAQVAIDTQPGEVFTGTIVPGASQAVITLWLPFGEHKVRVEAEGFEAMSSSLQLKGREPLRVQWRLSPAVPSEAPPPEAPPPELPPLSPPPAPEAPPPAPVEGRGVSVGPWITIGAGIAAAAVGGVFHGAASSSRDQANTAADNGDRDAYDGHVDDFELQRGLSYGLFIAGGAAVGAGLLWFFLDDTAEPDAALVGPVGRTRVDALSVMPIDGGGVMRLEGRF